MEEEEEEVVEEKLEPGGLGGKRRGRGGGRRRRRRRQVKGEGASFSMICTLCVRGILGLAIGGLGFRCVRC